MNDSGKHSDAIIPYYGRRNRWSFAAIKAPLLLKSFLSEDKEVKAGYSRFFDRLRTHASPLPAPAAMTATAAGPVSPIGARLVAVCCTLARGSCHGNT